MPERKLCLNYKCEMADLPDNTSKEKHATFSFEMTRCDYYGNYTQKSQRNQELF